MKKILFMAVSCLALMSCVKETLINTPDKEISFTSPIVGKNTKVTGELPATYNTSEKFVVSAYWTGSTYTAWSGGSIYMDNVEVSNYADGTVGDPNNSKSTWAPATKYYWPKDGYLTFVAYSPSSIKATGAGTSGATINKASGAISITNYTIENKADRGYLDILYSNVAANKQESTGSNGTYDGVDIEFNHALSSIWTKIQTAAEYSGTTFKVISVKYKNVLSTGTFTKTVASPNDAAWAAETTKTDYTAHSTTGTIFSNTSVALNAEETALLLMPQTIPNDAEIEVVYTMKSTTGDEITQTKTAKLSTTSLNQWEMGKRYTYNIKIGLQEIYFAPSVSAWVDNSTNPIDTAI